MLEKLGKFLGKPKFAYMISRNLWEEFGNIYFEYYDPVKQKEPEVSHEEKKINKLLMLKKKRKLSKKKEKELSKLMSEEKRKKIKKKGKEEDKQLKRVIREELRETSAVVATKKTRGTAKQILLKVFYIAFKVLREYPLNAGLDSCITAIDRNSVKADPSFLKSVLGELKVAFDFFSNPDLKCKVNKTTKQMVILHAIIRISGERSWLIRFRFGY